MHLQYISTSWFVKTGPGGKRGDCRSSAPRIPLGAPRDRETELVLWPRRLELDRVRSRRKKIRESLLSGRRSDRGVRYARLPWSTTIYMRKHGAPQNRAYFTRDTYRRATAYRPNTFRRVPPVSAYAQRYNNITRSRCTAPQQPAAPLAAASPEAAVAHRHIARSR